MAVEAQPGLLLAFPVALRAVVPEDLRDAAVERRGLGRAGKGGEEEESRGSHASPQARTSGITRAGSTPVSFWSSPWDLNVSLLWSNPNWWRMVACRSRTCTGSLTML